VHIKSENDITIIYKNVKNNEKFYNLDTLNIGINKSLISIGKNAGKNEKVNLSMEMYIMKKEIFVKIIEDAIETGESNYLKQALFKVIGDYNISTYKFDGYLACVNSSKNFYDANMDMLNIDIYKQLFTEERPIFTKVKDEPSTIYRENSKVRNSLVANGCDIEGEVNNSIIFRDVHVAEGTTINNSIIMQRTTIEEECSLNNVILDKYVKISKGNALAGDKKVPYIISKGLTI
jgi:glucose-1-phosphate adenylyltransferase